MTTRSGQRVPPAGGWMIGFGFILAAAVGIPAPAQEYRKVSVSYAALAGQPGAGREGDSVLVRGVATTGDDTFARPYKLGYVQDDSAGIALFDRERRMPEFRPGDVLEVRGRIVRFRGAPQIAVDSVEKLGSGRPPRPIDIRPEEAASPKFKGRLVRVKSRVESVNARSGVKVSLESPGPASLSFYVYEHLAPEILEMQLEPGSVVQVTGIASQYDPVPPYDTGYQILPRAAEDVTVAGEPLVDSSLLRNILLASLLIAAAVAGWIFFLRRQVKRHTESLAKTVAVLEAQQEATLDGILVTDSDGNVTNFNHRFSTIWGIPPEEIQGSSATALMTKQAERVMDGPLFTSRFAELMNGNSTSVVGHEEVLLKDGRIVALSSVPVTSAGRSWRGRAWYFQDVTRRKLLERQVEQATRVQSLGRLSAGLAHEFNNVLMGIQPFVELLKRECTDERQQQALSRIQQALARGKKTTSEVLRFTRPAEPAWEPIEVSEFLQSVGGELRGLLRQEIELRVVPPSEPMTAAGDQEMLAQVFVNLAANAQDAIHGGGSITMRAEPTRGRSVFPFGVVADGEYVHFTLSDTGSGIPEDLLPHIFEPLFTIKRGRGSGLGLAFVQQVMIEHRGHVFVESEMGEGTTFHLFIRRGDHRKKTLQQPGLSATVAPLRILLVEDDAVIVEGLAASLRFNGMTVRVAESGEEALNELAKDLPDVVVLDVDLPGLSGDQVFAHIRRQWRSLPVVFSTGDDRRDLLSRLAAEPRVRVLFKPYETASLIQALSEVTSPGRRSPDNVH